MFNYLLSFRHILTLLANLILGGIPSLTFFTWVERNCNIPWKDIGLAWPQVNIGKHSLFALLLWNSLPFALFASLHTTLAQPRSQNILLKIFEPWMIRSVYMVITGLCLSLMMALWQNTEITLWSLPISSNLANIISIALFWLFMACAGWTVIKFDAFSFLGFKQIFQRSENVGRTEGSNKLLTKGIYGIVRHPMYTFTLSAFLFTPVMSLDRFWVFILSFGYLMIGIPIEEKKLVKIFGEPYTEYRKKVPAVFPKLTFGEIHSKRD